MTFFNKDWLTDRYPHCKNTAVFDNFLELTKKGGGQYEFGNIQEECAFVAVCSVETGGFTVFKENLYYTADRLMQVWPSRFPTADIANECAKNPEAIAKRVYDNRPAIGNTNPGDGYKYLGRGCIQLTGRIIYTDYQTAMREAINPSDLENPANINCIRSALWYWFDYRHGLRKAAQEGDMKTVTHLVNGGYGGLEERTAEYNYWFDYTATQTCIFDACK